jgi:histidinol dehydrogenase/sulfopropanediol 3-dehydrogenase
MAIIPAKVAGVDEIHVCTPPKAHPAVLYAAHRSGATRIYRIGGAQGIAALAFGTATIPAVDKICGPGNKFVNEAKRQVLGFVGIDQLVGLSEIFIIADGTGDPRILAADLLGQAEHDVDTRVGLVTDDADLGWAVVEEVRRQLPRLATADVARVAWERRGEVALCADLDACIAYSDHVGPEHLQVHTADPAAVGARLRNYGSLFIGVEAWVVYSDKIVGTNHILPTGSAARYTGGVWVGTFLKVCTHQRLTRAGVDVIAPVASRQSAREGLDGHRKAAAVRLDPSVV